MDNKSLIRYKIFQPFDSLLAFTTTKKTLETENVRFSDKPENRLRLAELLNIENEKLVFPKQTHSNCVVELSEPPEKTIEETDALITDQPGFCICVQTADCVPILLFDKVYKIISVVHAGWRGTVNKIVQISVQKMVQSYGCSFENILVAIGPSISPEVYEVGNEVVEAARNSIPCSELTLDDRSGKFHFNLWQANRQLLLSCGLKSENIEILGQCSFLEEEKYYSARRDGVDTGRMVSGMMLKP